MQKVVIAVACLHLVFNSPWLSSQSKWSLATLAVLLINMEKLSINMEKLSISVSPLPLTLHLELMLLMHFVLWMSSWIIILWITVFRSLREILDWSKTHSAHSQVKYTFAQSSWQLTAHNCPCVHITEGLLGLLLSTCSYYYMTTDETITVHRPLL